MKLLPWGKFDAIDGRGPWHFDQKAADALMSRYKKRGSTELVIDYEHQTILSEQNGKPAPASGWIKKLVAVAGQGLFALVEWTTEAAAMIAAGQYKYVSPVFTSDANGRISELFHAGLTNNPGLRSLDQAISLRFAEPNSQLNPTGDTSMNPLLIALCALLGIKGDATEQEAIEAVTRLKNERDSANGSAEALKANQFDPKKHVTAEQHKAVNDELTALKSATAKSEITAAVEAAIKEGKLTVAQKPWALSQSKESLSAFLKDAPVTVPTTSQTNGEPEEPGAHGLNADELQVCKNLGIKPEDFAKSRKTATA